MTDAPPSALAAAPPPVVMPPSEPPLRGLRKWALVAELVSAAAVVISLIFVGVQIAQSNKLAHQAAVREQITELRSISQAVYEHPDIVDIVVKATNGGQMTQAETVRLNAFLMSGERTWEAAYHQYLDGEIDPVLWEAQRQQARSSFNEPFYPAFWEARKSWFTPAYREYRDAERAKYADEKQVIVPPAQLAPQPAPQQ